MTGLTKLSREWERRCLMDDPFAGDFGGSGDADRVLSDKIVTCRKACECHTCGGECKPGTRTRSRVEVYDGTLMRFKWCQACSRAMSVYGERPSILETRISKRVALTEAEGGR